MIPSGKWPFITMEMAMAIYDYGNWSFMENVTQPWKVTTYNKYLCGKTLENGNLQLICPLNMVDLSMINLCFLPDGNFPSS